jgi:hypothetical protein
VEDHAAKKRRAIERRKSEGPQEARVADEAPRKRLFHTTFDLVKEGLQKLVSSLPGMKRISKKQKVSYQDIKHTRLARAIRQGAYDFFCNDGNFGFLLDMIAQLPHNKRQECIREALTRFQSEASAVLQRKELRKVCLTFVAFCWCTRHRMLLLSTHRGATDMV